MDILTVFALAMTPVGELRISIPYGMGLQRLDWLTVYLVSLAGNMIPPLIIVNYFDRLPLLKNWSFIQTRASKKKKWIQRWGWIGLLLLVAIPMPGTGAWTGSLVSFMLKLPKIPSLIAIFFGISIAGTIVMLASLGIIQFFNVAPGK